MENINTEGLSLTVSTKTTAFLDELLGSGYAGNIHSFTIVGSALTPDFDEKASVINSVEPNSAITEPLGMAFINFPQAVLPGEVLGRVILV